MPVLHRTVAGLLACLPLAAHGARPMVTDDARLVEKDHCQIETLYKEQRTYGGSEFWFIPACNPAFMPTRQGVEIGLAVNRIEGEGNGVVQAKYLFKELSPNGLGIAASVGSFSGQPYLNAIASFSFFDDRAAVHANLGRFKDDGSSWGVGLEALLLAPHVYGIVETYGQRSEAPTWHYGMRFWVIPGLLQMDATRGDQRGEPERRFYTIGLRVAF